MVSRSEKRLCYRCAAFSPRTRTTASRSAPRSALTATNVAAISCDNDNTTATTPPQPPLSFSFFLFLSISLFLSEAPTLDCYQPAISKHVDSIFRYIFLWSLRIYYIHISTRIAVTFTYVYVICSRLSAHVIHIHAHTGDVILHARKSGMEQRSRVECKRKTRKLKRFCHFIAAKYTSLLFKSFLTKLIQGGCKLPNYRWDVTLHWNAFFVTKGLPSELEWQKNGY